jgi:replication fork protection complex subunit Tof1/Swi1
VYVPGDEATGYYDLTSDCLRDLKRFLRLDEEEKDRTTHLLLGKWKFVETDLIPLLITSSNQKNYKLAMATCEVLVPLTWPIEKNSSAEEKDILIMYKAAFLKKGTWNAVYSNLTPRFSIMLHLFSVPYSQRPEKDQARLRLLLCLVRNVLAIADSVDSVASSKEQYWNSTLQEDLIVLMKAENMLDLIISLAASANEPEFRQWSALMLEIVYCVFRERSVEDIFKKVVRP